MLVLQIVLYCLLFFLLVKCAVRDDGRNCLYFYPAEYINEAQKRGLADKEAIMAKGKRFMIPFCIVMLLVVPLLIVAVWNRAADFKTAYIQSVLLFVVMNWFDGVVMDRFWVAHSRIWVIEGMEGVPYVKPWKTVLVKRSLATVLYLILALVIAGLAVLIGKL